jgi:hypothetical protein
MQIIISTLNNEKTFNDKDRIFIGSHPKCDYILNPGFDLLLTVQYNALENSYSIVNNVPNDNKVLFKGQPMGKKIDVDNVCKLMIANSNEFISVKIIHVENAQKTVGMIEKEDFTEDDMKGLYGADINASTKIKIEKRKSDIEKVRITITKQVAYSINDLRKRLSANFKTTIFLHVAMFISALICAFAVSNYLMGLKYQDIGNFLRLPTNIKMLFMFSALFFGLCLLLKQSVYINLQQQLCKEMTMKSKKMEVFMLLVSALALVCIYAINLIYYMSIDGLSVFAILIPVFFVGLMITLAISCGYFKNMGKEMSVELDKFEYREDFENVMNHYQKWIELFINNLSKTKITNIKDKLFTFQLKSLGETIVGILTAPFLAYGVSNTLAMCFPEAAGWLRISGLRISPVFLVLATFLIIFAFFAFVNGFLCMKKVQGSNVIKQDGFNNYLLHGVDIYGLEGVRKLTSEQISSFVIAISIIFIEFSMNISYFMSEIGGDFQGIFLSLVAALVPTALLIAESYMLSQTKFCMYASEELISKLDRD